MVPAVADRRVGWWLRFLAGFAVLYGTLAGLAEIDATGRLGLPILAVVLLVALVVERTLDGAPPAVALRARRRARADRVRIGARGRRGRDGVAAATTVPFAYLWEMGRRTIWAPALLHTTIDTFKLVVLPPGVTVTLSLVLAAVSATVPFLVLAVPRTVRSQNRDLDDADR